MNLCLTHVYRSSYILPTFQIPLFTEKGEGRKFFTQNVIDGLVSSFQPAGVLYNQQIIALPYNETAIEMRQGDEAVFVVESNSGFIIKNQSDLVDLVDQRFAFPSDNSSWSFVHLEIGRILNDKALMRRSYISCLHRLKNFGTRLVQQWVENSDLLKNGISKGVEHDLFVNQEEASELVVVRLRMPVFCFTALDRFAGGKHRRSHFIRSSLSKIFSEDEKSYDSSFLSELDDRIYEILDRNFDNSPYELLHAVRNHIKASDIEAEEMMTAIGQLDQIFYRLSPTRAATRIEQGQKDKIWEIRTYVNDEYMIGIGNEEAQSLIIFSAISVLHPTFLDYIEHTFLEERNEYYRRVKLLFDVDVAEIVSPNSTS